MRWPSPPIIERDPDRLRAYARGFSIRERASPQWSSRFDELCDGITCGGHLSWFPRGRDFPFATKFPGRSPKLPVRSAKFPDSNHKIPGSIFTGNFALTPGILAIFLALNGQ
jgi:hypothetical protein